ncbi:DNA adenine methylase [Vreelandella titanicae]|uniref:DNA adenine methylase n=1 Tax=Vreelandella titanicae TaxID=664683 RepID=UPI003D2D6A23
MSDSFATPLRYPGGKGRLGAWLSELISYNDLTEGCYIEPYAGGAGAAMYLLAQKKIDRVVINDIDPIIYSFWWAVLNDNENFQNLIINTPLDIGQWHAQKEVICSPSSHSLTEVGFASFFLNRTNRSGIIKGGVIGGQKQQGKYKIDARFNRTGLAKRVNSIGKLRDKISLYNLDAIELINKIGDNKKNLYYLDPPYYKKGEQLYRNSYKNEDHINVAETVKNLSSPWLVTYDNCSEILQIYDWDKSFEFSLYYSTHLSRPIGKEICFFNGIDIHKEIYLKR